jgi:site-specific recombinase XerD
MSKMITTSFGLLFYLKKNTKSTDNEQPIYLRITVSGIPKEISIQRYCLSSRWNAQTGRAIGLKEEIRALNSYLDTIQSKVFEARHRLIENGKPVTSEAIKCFMQGKEEKGHSLLEIFQHHNSQVQALVGIEYSEGTMTKFKTVLNHTREFLKWKYQVNDIEVRKLDYDFISDLEFWYKSVQHIDHNTTMKYIACCKKMVIVAMKKGWLTKDPFMGYKLGLREVHRQALSEEQIQRISVKIFPTERLTLVRDIFLFSCYTGLAYIDVKKLKRSQISNGIDGSKWIFTHRQKTDSPTRIPILPQAIKILEIYASHKQCQVKDKALPIMSNQKMNAYLKEIADCCGIGQNLTFHIARHTFATKITLSNGVPIETVSKMLGHRNLKTTQHYAKILDRKVSEDMQALKEKLSAKNI